MFENFPASVILIMQKFGGGFKLGLVLPDQL